MQPRLQNLAIVLGAYLSLSQTTLLAQNIDSQSSTLCYYLQGFRIGQTDDYAPRPPLPIGSQCSDGSRNSGVVVSSEKSTLCSFQDGPRKGETEDYAPKNPVNVGIPCSDGISSSGKIVSVARNPEDDTWHLMPKCAAYTSSTPADWRTKHLKIDRIDAYYVIVQSLDLITPHNQAFKEREAKRIAREYRAKFPRVDFDAMITASPTGDNKRFAIVLARALDTKERACDIRDFAASCRIASDAYVHRLGSGPDGCSSP